MPDKLNIYEGLGKIPIRPFVELVTQCFQCYGYGHWKENYRKKKICVICGEEFHGRCKKKEKCVNCKEEHKTNDRRCRIYNRYVAMNKAVAEDRISTYEAKRKIMEKEKDIYRERRRSEDGAQWTKRDERNKKGKEVGVR